MPKMVYAKSFILVLTGLIIGAACSPYLLKSEGQPKKPYTMIGAFITNAMIKGFNGTWISDTEFVYRSHDKGIDVFNTKINDSKEFVSEEDMTEWPSFNYELSKNNKKVLIRYDSESIFRHSIIARYDVLDLDTKKSYHLANNKKLRIAVWSPTNDRIAYVLDNNVYIRQPDGNEIQLTTDGVNNVIYNGVPDWVYEEEVLQKGGALWFSPDGQKLAIGHFNDEAVITYTYQKYGEPKGLSNQYPEELHLKYPKPGTPNPKVQLRVIDLDDIEKGWKVLRPPVHIVSEDHILRSVTWVNKDQLLVVWHNRRQNIASIQICDIFANCDEVRRLQEPDGWIVAGDPICYDDKHCLITNWIGNWLQVWNLDVSTGVNEGESLGNITVTDLYGYKKSTGELFYQGAIEQDPAQHHVYKNRECLSCGFHDADGTLCRQAKAKFSRDFSYYALTCHGPFPAITKIYHTETNAEITPWESNKYVRKDISTHLLPIVNYLRVPVKGGYQASVKLVLPPEITTNPNRKYPMIVTVYGGPNSVRVNNAFSVGWEGYLSTNRKIVYAFIDGRGTGNKGKKMLFEINNKLGTVEYQDTLSVTEYLQNTFSFIDSNRTGLWGWSYGGFVTALTLSKDKERVFRCGISVAPVTSWIYYDSIYTERFMGLPRKDDNLIGYETADVTRNVENFKTHDFLLIHGSGDDNVHVQQSFVLSRALQLADIQFEQMIYPDEDHSIGNAFDHNYHTMERFWVKCFNLTSGNQGEDEF